MLNVRNMSDASMLVKGLVALAHGQGTRSALESLASSGFEIVSGSAVPRAGSLPAFTAAASRDTVVLLCDGVRTNNQVVAIVESSLEALVVYNGIDSSRLFLSDGGILAKFLLSVYGGKGYHLVLCGYSYGGGLALVAAGLLGASDFRSIQVLTAGSPRPGGSMLADRCATFQAVLRVMEEDDPIPFFPFHYLEHPAFVVSVGPVAALRWSQWVQPGGGIIVDYLGRAGPAQLPTLLMGGNTLPLVAYLTLACLAPGASHSLSAYASSVSLAAQTSAGTIPTRFVGRQEGPDRVLKTPWSSFANSVLADKLSLNNRKDGSLMGYIPPAYRPKVVKVGLGWSVFWMGQELSAGDSQSHAKATAKWLFKWLRVVQGSYTSDPVAWTEAVGLFAVSAASSSAGFNPPFNFA